MLQLWLINSENTMTHIIEESKIQKRNENGGLFKQAIFEQKNTIFKYVIQTDNYNSQAYAKLYAWTKEKGFSLVISKPLVEYYGSNPAFYFPHGIIRAALKNINLNPISYFPHGISEKEKEFFSSVSKDMIDIAIKFSSYL